MNLVIDIGNTLCKVAIFQDDRLEELWTGVDVDKEAVDALVEKYRPVAGIVSTVRRVDDAGQPARRGAGVPNNGAAGDDKTACDTGGDQDAETARRSMENETTSRAINHQDDKSSGVQKKLPAALNFLASYGFPVLVAGVHLRLPFTMRYRTPETLGSDRLAAAVAARHLHPNEDVLVIGAGTCLTTDFVTEKGEYLGGTIAPGLRMRLQALHHYTGNLPLVEEGVSGAGASQDDQDASHKTPLPGSATQENHEAFLPGQTTHEDQEPSLPGQTTSDAKAPQNDQGTCNNPPLPGQTTREAILAGAIHGMAAEMDGLIDGYRKKISFFNVILTGGDRKTFDKKLKNRIFAVENIVLHGLNQLLKHNV